MLRKHRWETKKYKICPNITLKIIFFAKSGRGPEKSCGWGLTGLSKVTFTLSDHLAGQNIHILPTNPLRVENLLSRREKLYCTTLP